MDAPRDNLTRSVPFEITRTAEDGDGLTFEGYAAVWDSPTEINSRSEGNFIERIKPGAFKRTLNAKMPVFMFDHGQHPMIGSMPLGVIQGAREDARGLFIQARFSNNWLIQPVRDACAEGAIPGMSFRMSIPEGGETWRRGKNGGLDERDVTEIKCYELGPVVFPAYEDTSVGVRSTEALESLERLRESLDALTSREVRVDLARAMFMVEERAESEPEERMVDMEAAQLALRDAIKLHQAHMAGEPSEDGEQQLLNHLLNLKAMLSGGTPEMKSAEPADTEISRDEDVAETEPAETGTSAEPQDELDPTDEVTPRGATDPETDRFLRQLKARELGVI